MLNHTVSQLDDVRALLDNSPTEQERELLREQELLLLNQVDQLVPDPSSRKTSGILHPRR